MNIKYLLLAFIVLAGGQIRGAEAGPKSDYESRLAWWREARFGMFIHYGPVSLTGLELSWSRANTNPRCPNKGPTPAEVYDNLYRRFNPTNFNAAEWVATARSAGMRYVVLTAKHCDGFLLWDSRVDAYNIMATPFHRDICGELANAVRDGGLRLGWYFSPMDWRDPDCRTGGNAAFLGRMRGEITELLGRYGNVDLLWFDYDGREAVFDPDRTYALVRSLQPRIIINNRLDLGVGRDNTELLNPNADYYTPEQRVGAYDDRHPWETCMTLGEQWSWKPQDRIKSVAEVVSILARTAGGDGNLLLDVGPEPDGLIEPRQAEVLRGVGEWLKANGESIYGTRGGPWKPKDSLSSTRKGSVIYVAQTGADNGIISLPAIPRRVVSANVLGGGGVEVETRDGKLILHPRKGEAGRAGTVVKLLMDGPVMELPAVEVSR
jgi:alpha-L-fucosidase